MSAYSGVDGPLRIAPGQPLDLTPCLEEIGKVGRDYRVFFKVGSIELEDDTYSVEESSQHVMSSVGGTSASFSFEVDDEPTTTIRSVDFALGTKNDLFLSACDARVRSITLEDMYILAP